jgi:hypothetical protein
MSRSTAVLSIVLFAAATSAAASVTIKSNVVKYRDSSIPHATGRAGDATIDALALYGKDGMTDLTVTSNGSIDKVQLKTDDGHAVNYTNLGGAAFTQQLVGLAAHAPLQVQANVSSVDAARTDVVTAEEIVKYRPDLEVADVRAPERAMPGMPFEVTATVRELNGDVGARATCVLSSKGVELDRANGIWVDAGGTVACKFATALSAMGTQTLTVSATNVDPGDWDDGNNAASADITIAEPFASYNAAVWEGTAHQHILYSTPYRHMESTTDRWEQWTSFFGVAPAKLDIDKIDASYSESSDGTPIDSFSYGSMTWYTGNDSSDWRCRSGYNDWSQDLGLIAVCVGNPFGPYFSTISASRSTTEATYLASQWSSVYRGSGGDVYIDNTTGGYRLGMDTPHYGTSVSLVVTLSDGTSTYQGAPTIPLVLYSRQYGMPYNCETWGYEICRENLTTEIGRQRQRGSELLTDWRSSHSRLVRLRWRTMRSICAMSAASTTSTAIEPNRTMRFSAAVRCGSPSMKAMTK